MSSIDVIELSMPKTRLSGLSDETASPENIDALLFSVYVVAGGECLVLDAQYPPDLTVER